MILSSSRSLKLADHPNWTSRKFIALLEPAASDTFCKTDGKKSTNANSSVEFMTLEVLASMAPTRRCDGFRLQETGIIKDLCLLTVKTSCNFQNTLFVTKPGTELQNPLAWYYSNGGVIESDYDMTSAEKPLDCYSKGRTNLIYIGLAGTSAIAVPSLPTAG